MRGTLYRTARLLGDLKAARRGPAALGRRMVRKVIYGRALGLAGRVARMLGVGR